MNKGMCENHFCRTLAIRPKSWTTFVWLHCLRQYGEKMLFTISVIKECVFSGKKILTWMVCFQVQSSLYCGEWLVLPLHQGHWGKCWCSLEVGLQTGPFYLEESVPSVLNFLLQQCPMEMLQADLNINMNKVRLREKKLKLYSPYIVSIKLP